MKNKKLFLLDVFPILYRAHFAMLQQPLSNSDGLRTSAILGFCNYLFQILFKEKPAHIAAAFDSRSEQRTAELESYKATREKMPEDIGIAKEYVRTIINALNIKTLEQKGFEADDLIGTIAIKAAAKGFEVYIVSPDKDFAQLASDKIFLYRPSYKGVNFEVLNHEGVKEKFGVPPYKITDLLALKGDTADNIPGVPRIGDKTALDLLSKFDSLEELLEKKQEVLKPSIRQTLTDNEELARLSKRVATIHTDLALDFNEQDFRLQGPDTGPLVKVLDALEFVRLKERIFSNPFYSKLLSKQEEERQEEDKLVFELTEACLFNNVTVENELESILDKVREDGKFYFLHSVSGNYLNLYFTSGNERYYYHVKGTELPEALVELLQSPSVEKVTYNSKSLNRFLLKHECVLAGKVADLMLQHYVLSPDADHMLERMIAQELSVSFRGSLTGDAKWCYELEHLPKLYNKLHSSLQELDQLKLYDEIDQPLSTVLARMENHGIAIDEGSLEEISQIFRNEIAHLEQRIYALAGREFNIRSSRQTSELLSEILKDTTLKKTKTGQISTSEATLMEFAGNYEIAELLLRHRKISKLLSTYTESLPGYVDGKTGRIHADFLQTRTATGRLSCINPNLQNLPIRSEEGREVRKAVVPENDDYLILSADYSQIELRLLAALSKDEGLAYAFANKLDVHTITAARVYNVKETEVTEEMRSKAKMVNYGIAYGISVFGLTQRLKIPMSESRQIIDQYFKSFPRIKQYIDGSIALAREKGYSSTLTGRRRYIEDINSRNGTERRAAERIAINAPIQGLAADLIKLSMISLDKYFRERKLKSKMLMQVHDELVFEVHKSELDEVARVVREKMEKAIDLAVPVEVNIGVGENWLDLEDYLAVTSDQ